LPNLDQTLNKYLISIKPFVTQTQFNRTKDICDRFKAHIGIYLNDKLKERALSKRNWLEEWWLDYAYLELRLPVAPFMNTIGHYVNLHDCILKNEFNGSIQNAVASLQVYYLMKFYDDLKHERFLVEKSKNGFLSMNQYRYLFNTCRLPGVGKDALYSSFKTCNSNIYPHFKLSYFCLLNRQRRQNIFKYFGHF
jgi:carnitine O-octanoyltransferase